MPEYLAPGVFVEEVSFRSKSIEGVPTSTTGFAGATRFGPVWRDGGPSATAPRLVTSFTEFERVYGGLEPLLLGGVERPCYLAHAARAFFVNGGQRLYVSRVYTEPADGTTGVAAFQVPVGPRTATWTARWPGRSGEVLVSVAVVRSRNVAVNTPAGVQARGARAGSLVEVLDAAPAPGTPPAPLAADRLVTVALDADGNQVFEGSATVSATSVLQLVDLQVQVSVTDDRTDVYDGISTHPRHKRAITRILGPDDPEDEDAAVYLDWDPGQPADHAQRAVDLAVALSAAGPARLAGGDDGLEITAAALEGQEADPDDVAVPATGLYALGDVEDIAIVAAPDTGALEPDESRTAAQALVTHAETLKYRIAIVDGPEASSISEIREFRGRFDSKHAALYHPWVVVADPLQPAVTGAPPPLIPLPPSGFVAGIYARSDIERGVWKAPANEIVRGGTRFEANINTRRQQVLNPEGINALRFFEGRGDRVWGARTMSSDPEWKYVNVRRLFAFLEHSIDKATQWAVFEPNGPRLWANLRQTIEDFLLVQWRDGALLGGTPDEAYFVRCDRTTMTQNDLDNGRLICLVGVAPVRPAEFVIFRIGQWTADAKAA